MKTVAYVGKRILFGCLTGFVYYVVYVVLLPTLLASALQVSVAVGKAPVFLFFFIALGTAESILKDNPVSIPLRILSKLFGALILYVLMDGGRLSTAVSREGLDLYVEFDMSILLYTIILLSLVYGFIDAFSFYTSKNGS